jgi:hypothetical protein
MPFIGRRCLEEAEASTDRFLDASKVLGRQPTDQRLIESGLVNRPNLMAKE